MPRDGEKGEFGLALSSPSPRPRRILRLTPRGDIKEPEEVEIGLSLLIRDGRLEKELVSRKLRSKDHSPTSDSIDLQLPWWIRLPMQHIQEEKERLENLLF